MSWASVEHTLLIKGRLRTCSSLSGNTSSGTQLQWKSVSLQRNKLSQMTRITSSLGQDGSTLNPVSVQPVDTQRCPILCWQSSKVLEPKLSQEKGNSIYWVLIQCHPDFFEVLQKKKRDDASASSKVSQCSMTRETMPRSNLEGKIWVISEVDEERSSSTCVSFLDAPPIASVQLSRLCTPLLWRELKAAHTSPDIGQSHDTQQQTLRWH